VKPPDALSRAAAIVNGLEDPLVPADSVSPNVSRSVAQVLQTAMSQKRDDRYESAETMREALRSASTGALGEVPTVLTSTGTTTHADTVAPAAGTQMVGQRTQGGGSEAQTLLADEATKVRSQSAGAGLAQSSSRSSRGMWLAAAVVLLMIVGGAAGFFIYRARQSRAAATLPAATPAPSAEPAGASTVTEDIKGPEQQSTELNPNPDADKRAKQASATKPVVKPTPEVANERDAGHDPNRRPPEPPPFDPLRNSNDRRPLPPEPRVRDFPNGTRVERRADGSTVVTFPDGRTRVFPAGTRPNPRRRPGP